MTPPPDNEDIYSKVRKIRDFINEPRIKAELFKNTPLFYQLCSGMDMVADSQSAIDSFGKQNIGETERGHVYLDIFGLLQALFLQQDATRHLAESLQFPINIEEYPRLKEIREIRNNAVGHPTKRGNPPHSWNFIVQISMNHDHFEVLQWHSPQGHTTTHVNTREIISDQEKYVAEILSKTYAEIKRRDDEYKAKHRMKKIADTLPDTAGYMCEKMSTAIDHLDELNLGEWGCTSLQHALEQFEAELQGRGIAINTYPGIEMTYTELAYPLSKLQEHFAGNESLDTEQAHIYVHFVRERFNELKEMAKELDKDFES